jgi:hypothetical protein
MPAYEGRVEGHQALAHVRVQVHKLAGRVRQRGQTVGVQVLVLGVRHVVVHCFDYDQDERVTYD